MNDFLSAAQPMASPVHLVVMGVSGCGKSSLAEHCARALGLPMVEGDDFHSRANVAKMQAGTPLTDADREGWLDELGQQLQAHPAGAVLSCSALRLPYRERLRQAVPHLRFVFLSLTQAQAHERVASRAAHMFPAQLVASQFEALEDPSAESGVLRLDATLPPSALASRTLEWL